jgi:hypothetical protein
LVAAGFSLRRRWPGATELQKFQVEKNVFFSLFALAVN